MSAKKMPILLTMHAVFQGLQEDIKTILCILSNSVLPNIKRELAGLTISLVITTISTTHLTFTHGLHVCI